MRFCNQCGNDVGINDVFCSECGTKLKSKDNNHIIEDGDKDKSIKADLKIEVTNATTEKAFKKVGETVEGGKKAVKKTTGILKKLFVPALILFIIAVVIGVFIENEQSKKRKAFHDNWMKELEQKSAIEEKNRLQEERSCVIQEYNKFKTYGNTNTVWGFVQTMCHLSYKEVEQYQKELGKNLEKVW